MSLRIRLSIIVCMLLVCGMILGVLFQVSQASQRVENEVNSSASLTYQLLTALSPAATVQSETILYQVLSEQLQNADSARHLNINIYHPDESVEELLLSDAESKRVPGWFTELVQPEPLQYELTLAGGSTVTINTNPDDEISEVWNETLRFIVVLSTVLIAMTVILLYFLGRWLRPVQQIVSSIEKVEQGNFTETVPAGSLPELRLIAAKLNHLNEVLRQSKEENDRLNKLSLKVQEEERKRLARELHDEMGQSVSAIKAIAFSIAERTATIDKECQEGARQIGEITNGMRDQVRRMMSQLRPAELDDLGLQPALQQMVDDWNRHHQHTFCSMQYDEVFSKLPSEQQTHFFRIIQEALTNVARHASASQARVILEYNEGYSLLIEDDGRGYEKDTSASGMGMRGIRERVHAMGGCLVIDSRPGLGTRLDIRIPDTISTP